MGTEAAERKRFGRMRGPHQAGVRVEHSWRVGAEAGVAVAPRRLSVRFLRHQGREIGVTPIQSGQSMPMLEKTEQSERAAV